ncbi:hypothetical protein N7G274_006069 [Stereocaulon virgatum]|uniref:Uncharacterized protein n=1 Tax=Stereocaulon virgatum TaxID=373712 RepID=A0ABR4A6M5_9LECA
MVEAIAQGVTQKRNSELFDAQHKAGIFLKTLNDDPRYRHGSSDKGNLNTVSTTNCKSKAKRAGVCAPASPPKPDEGPKNAAGANIDLSDILKQNELSSDTKLQDTLFGSGKDSDSKTTVFKAEEALKTFTTVGKDALVALGVAGDLVGVAFVILDFVDLLSLPVSPLRNFNDTLPLIRTDQLSRSALPLAFQAPKVPPHRRDVQQIIQ